jgi:hypothetical protein
MDWHNSGNQGQFHGNNYNNFNSNSNSNTNSHYGNYPNQQQQQNNSNNYNNAGPSMSGVPNNFQNQNFQNQPQHPFQNFDSINNPLMAAGISFVDKKADQLIGEGSTYWRVLKEYFEVNNKFVFAKLKLMFYPHFMSKTYNWSRLNDKKDLYGGGDNSGQNLVINNPELYIPFMSFVTYVLLLGLCQGLGSTGGATRFSPDTLIQTIWRCLVVHCLESCIIKFGISYFGYNMVYMDAFSYAGYKYVGLCFTIIAKIFGKFLTFMCGLYMSLAFCYFIMKTLSALLPQQGAGSGWDPRLTVILGISLLELIITLFFNSL